MDGLMMDYPLTITAMLRRTESMFGHKEIVSRRPDRSLERANYAVTLGRARRLASGLQKLGVGRSDRVATLCWNHLRHLEAYFGVPWFIVGFLALAIVRAAGAVPERWVAPTRSVSSTLTIVAMAALGLSADVRAVARAGSRVIAAVSLSLLLLVVLGIAFIHVLNIR